MPLLHIERIEQFITLLEDTLIQPITNKIDQKIALQEKITPYFEREDWEALKDLLFKPNHSAEIGGIFFLLQDFDNMINNLQFEINYINNFIKEQIVFIDDETIEREADNLLNKVKTNLISSLKTNIKSPLTKVIIDLYNDISNNSEQLNDSGEVFFNENQSIFDQIIAEIYATEIESSIESSVGQMNSDNDAQEQSSTAQMNSDNDDQKQSSTDQMNLDDDALEPVVQDRYPHKCGAFSYREVEQKESKAKPTVSTLPEEETKQELPYEERYPFTDGASFRYRKIERKPRFKPSNIDSSDYCIDIGQKLREFDKENTDSSNDMIVTSMTQNRNSLFSKKTVSINKNKSESSLDASEYSSDNSQESDSEWANDESSYSF